MARRKSFIVFCDRINELEMLTDEECGKLFKGLIHYVSDGVEFKATSLPLKLMFSVFKSQIDDNGEKYQKKKEANAEYYKKRKEGKKNSVISEISEDSKISENSASDTGTVTGTDTVTDTVTGTVYQSTHSHTALSRSPLESLIYDYGEENVEKYVQRVESWYAEKGNYILIPRHR